MFRKIIYYLKNPSQLIISLSFKGFLNWIPDRQFLKLIYRIRMGKKLDLDNPKTFNEKLQWLKIYDRNLQYTRLVDKYEVKKYISGVLSQKYVIPTLGVWNTFEEIDFEALPNQFVLKCTHDSGGLVICKDKEKLDFMEARKKINQSLRNNFFYCGREWPYRNVKPRIIAEQYMADNLRDYKKLCFDCTPRMMLIYSEHFTKDGLKEDFYDEVWEQNVQEPIYGDFILPVLRPEQYALMKELAEKFSEKMSFTRIDFYEINEKVYLGEITFDPSRGFEGFKPEEWNLNLGEWIKLSAGGYRLNSDICSIIITDSYYNNRVEKAINDYKVFCFDGEIDSIMVCTGREKGHPDFYFYDVNWKRLYYQHDGLEKSDDVEKPNNLDEMLRIAKILSQGFSHIRVDLFDIDNNIYFGELTFFDNSGFDTDISYETDLKWGEKISLPGR